MNNKVGITERGDGGLDFSWVDKIKDLKACIVISKNINDKLIKHLLELTFNAEVTFIKSIQIHHVKSMDVWDKYLILD